MIEPTKLAKAIAYAVAGLALSTSGASANVTTMYNLSSSYGADNSGNNSDPFNYGGGTDGWTNAGTGAAVGDGTGASKWAGTSGSNNVAFGYTGAHLNWALEISGGNGGSGEISAADSYTRYGVYADIDVAKGAWSDAAESGASGWRHDLDMGLFKSDTTGLVTLSAVGIQQSGTAFGFTIFDGVDSVTNYNHHGGWNSGNNANGITAGSSPYPNAIFAGTGLDVADIVAYSVGGANASNLNTITFNALAGHTYTIFIGGYRNGEWGDTNDGYALTVSQVPVPGAIWLFGSALLGLAGLRRRQA